MGLLVSVSASTKLDALLDALSLGWLQIAIFRVKCIKCINLLNNISILSLYTCIGGIANRWFYALDALFSLCISNLMHCLMHFDALFWPPVMYSYALILIQGAEA